MQIPSCTSDMCWMQHHFSAVGLALLGESNLDISLRWDFKPHCSSEGHAGSPTITLPPPKPVTPSVQQSSKRSWHLLHSFTLWSNCLRQNLDSLLEKKRSSMWRKAWRWWAVMAGVLAARCDQDGPSAVWVERLEALRTIQLQFKKILFIPEGKSSCWGSRHDLP